MHKKIDKLKNGPLILCNNELNQIKVVRPGDSANDQLTEEVINSDSLVVQEADMPVYNDPPIVTLSNPQDLRSFLESNADENTLVVFDCDEVLLKQGSNGSEPMNDQIVEIVSTLQDRGVRVLVLSAVFHINARIRELQRNGFHFENSWDGVQECSASLEPMFKFKQGVIISGNKPKGDFFSLFCIYLDQKYPNIGFSKVIFVDDLYMNVLSMQNAVEFNRGLAFLGVEYTEKNLQNQTKAALPVNPVEVEEENYYDERDQELDLQSVMSF